MNPKGDNQVLPRTRRDFLKTTAAAGTALAANLSLLSNVHAAGNDVIKVGLIGCGGRGTQAAENALHAAPNVKIVALGDVFEDRLKGCQSWLKKFAADDELVKKNSGSVDLPDERCHLGFDAYQKVLNSGVDYVILATPPGFRPIHLEAAVAAGKHIFTEKPVGTDGPGIYKVLNAYQEANKKNLCVVAGTQRRHQAAYLETLQRIHDGEIGEITAARCYWNQGALWVHPRQEGWSDMVYQLRNWYHFVWLCGDHIVEQHVHNLDVVNWALRQHPISAVGMGGRQVRTGPQYGQIFDHFAVDYEYPNGVHVLSMCRQIPGCAESVSEALAGTKGFCQVNRYAIKDLAGKTTWSRKEGGVNPYVQEHTDLIQSIRAGKPINELKTVAESTLTAIMGRMSAYTGKAITWDKALQSVEENVIWPARFDWDVTLPEPLVAVPGKTRLV
jgi:predicted dehydrogenase